VVKGGLRGKKSVSIAAFSEAKLAAAVVAEHNAKFNASAPLALPGLAIFRNRGQSAVLVMDTASDVPVR
jgi:hypothetical protein